MRFSSSTAARFLALAGACVLSWSVPRGVEASSAPVPPVGIPVVETSIQGPVVREWSGGPVAFPLQLRNRSDRPLELHVRLDLPAAWTALASDEPVRLEPGKSALRLLAVGIPASAPAGEHEVRWRVEDRVSGEEVGAGDLKVSVPARPAVSLAPDAAPEFIVAGTLRRVAFLLRNEGNVPLDIVLDARWTGGASPRAVPERTRLEPGATAPVLVSLQTDPAATGTGSRDEVLELQARADGVELDPVWASVPLEVVRSAENAPGPVHHSFPLRMAVGSAATGSLGGSGQLWGELSGSGLLRDGGTTRLSLLVRSPEPRAVGLGGRDRYHLTLEGDDFRMAGGDQLMRRTMLTEPGREAFGGSAEVELGPLRAGAFQGRNRRGTTDFDTRGAFVGLQAGDVASATLNRVVREGWDPADLWSVSARLHPGSLLDLSGELGWDASGEASDADRPAGAWRVGATGSWKRLRYTLDHLQVDSLYPGPYRGRREDMAHLGLRLTRSVRVEGTVGRTVRDHPSIFSGGASVDSRVSGGISWGRALTLEVRRKTEVRRGNGTVRRGSTSGRVRLGASIGPLWISPLIGYGMVRGDGLADPVPVIDAGLEISTEGRGSGFSTSVAYESGTSLGGYSGRERWVGRVGGRLALGTSVRLDALVQGYRALGPLPRTHALVQGGVTVKLPHGHELNANVRSSIINGLAAMDRTNLSLGYSIPLSVPMGRAGTAGRVVGRVVDGTERRGLDSVLVRMGGTAALTDADGRFVFPAVEPGQHRLRLDFGTVPSNRIVLGGDSRTVDVRGGDDSEAEFVLRPGGTIEGEVTLYERALTLDAIASEGGGSGNRQADLRPVGPVARALVVLEGPDGLRRRLTTSDGRFSLSGLAPGRWRVRVDREGLPARHSAVADAEVFELEPAGARSVKIRIEPEAPKIRLAGGGAVKVELDGPPDTGGAERDVESGARETPTPTTAPPARPVHWYTVDPLDLSLMQIARQVYDDGFLWPKIWAANQGVLPDPDRIAAGQRLRIPEKAPLTAGERRLLNVYEQDR